MAEGKKTDPAQQVKAASEAQKVEAKVKSLKDFSLKDFRPVPQTKARYVHPFEGYPLMEPIEVGTNKGKPVLRSATFIVCLNPAYTPEQDPAGLGRSVEVNNVEKVVNYETFHSRMLPDYDNGGINTDVVFDRKVELDGRPVCFAIVESHSLRAQLVFTWESKPGRIKTDDRYFLLDNQKQVGRLRRLFEMIINPRLKMERAAQLVTGEVEASEAALAALPDS